MPENIFNNVIISDTIKYNISKGPFSDIIPFIPSMIFNKIKKENIEKIYLFGSYAYGKPNKNSDIDICIVIKKGLRRPNIATKISTILRENNVVPSDLLVYRSKEFSEALKLYNIERAIINKGILLYERTN